MDLLKYHYNITITVFVAKTDYLILNGDLKEKNIFPISNTIWSVDVLNHESKQLRFHCLSVSEIHEIHENLFPNEGSQTRRKPKG